MTAVDSFFTWGHVGPNLEEHDYNNGCDINRAPFHKHHLRVALLHKTTKGNYGGQG
jgi:hypothetical protein